MKRTLRFAIAVAAVLGLAAAANAATVSIAADASSYNLGDTITITVSSDSEGELLFTATAFVAYTGPVTALATNQITGPAGWFTGNINALHSPGFQAAFDQLNFSGGDPGTGIGATITFSADAPGVATFTISSNPVNLIAFDFGTATAGDSVQVTIVPEPTTAALLGLGLFGLAVAGRRR